MIDEGEAMRLGEYILTQELVTNTDPSLEQIDMQRLGHLFDEAALCVMTYGCLPSTKRQVDALFENLPEGPPDED